MLTRLYFTVLICVVALQAGGAAADALNTIHANIDTCNTVECFMWYWDAVGFYGAVVQTAADLGMWRIVDILG